MSALPEISSYLPNTLKNPMMNFAPAVQNAPVVQPSYTPQKTIDYVKGFDGANAYNLGANSSALALDQDMNVIWVIATDQNGAKSLVKGYWVGDEYVPPKPVTMEDLMNEMKDMKSRMIKLEEESSHGEHNRQSAGQSKPDSSSISASKRNSASDSVGQSAPVNGPG